MILVRPTAVSQFFGEQPICDRVEVLRPAAGLASVTENLVKVRS